MPKKIRLADSALVDFDVIGITANESKEYKFVYQLNKALGSFFTRINNLDNFVKGSQYDYIAYESHDSLIESSLFLIKNSPIAQNDDLQKTHLSELFLATPLLIPELKNCNYILKIEENYNLEILLKNINIFYKTRQLFQQKRYLCPAFRASTDKAGKNSLCLYS